MTRAELKKAMRDQTWCAWTPSIGNSLGRAYLVTVVRIDLPWSQTAITIDVPHLHDRRRVTDYSKLRLATAQELLTL